MTGLWTPAHSRLASALTSVLHGEWWERRWGFVR